MATFLEKNMTMTPLLVSDNILHTKNITDNLEHVTICWRQCTRVTFGIQAARSILQKTAANNFDRGVTVCAPLAIIIMMMKNMIVTSSL